MRCFSWLVIPIGLLSCVGGGDTGELDASPDNPSFIDDGQVSLGFYEEDVFVSLEAGDPCWVINGIQGGTWSMPTVRAQGIGDLITLECAIEGNGGEPLGDMLANIKFATGPEGDLEYNGVPIPVIHDDPFGLEASLTCTAVDSDNHGGTSTVSVVLTYGHDSEWSAD